MEKIKLESELSSLKSRLQSSSDMLRPRDRVLWKANSPDKYCPSIGAEILDVQIKIRLVCKIKMVKFFNGLIIF